MIFLPENPYAAIAFLASILPFCAFALILLLFRRRPKVSAAISLSAITASLAFAVFLLVQSSHIRMPLQYTGTWLAAGDFSISGGILLDPLNLLMLALVAGISFLVQIYSLGYMKGDPGFSRYYALMSLFAWAMISLVLSATLIQLYIFWELVGLSSYFLIGFRYEKFSAATAGKKAFVMTRLGDVSFLLGLILILTHMGNLEIASLGNSYGPAPMTPSMITLSALLIFGGIIGKSAQFPLLTWLPDAMEGPTPVSALLHSATMVAAGVFLFARLFPYFTLSPSAMSVCLPVGTLSMLLASSMAMTARDLKQVWAFSTISQLGYMIMGLAAGDCFSGVFHLTTHAGFKALLYDNTHTRMIDELGGLSRTMPVAAGFFILAALTGIGVPCLASFWGELVVFIACFKVYPVPAVFAVTALVVTALFILRVVQKTCFGPENPKLSHLSDISFFSGIPRMILVSVIVILGLYPSIMFDIIRTASISLFNVHPYPPSGMEAAGYHVLIKRHIKTVY